MRVLFDTNIIIDIEKSHVIDESYSSLVRLLQTNNHQILIHPSSFADLERDSDQERKAINLSKLSKYELLKNPPDCLTQFIKAGISCTRPNDKVDCDMLCAVYHNAVHMLVTEDRRLHNKAKTLSISKNVFFVQQALAAMEAAHRQPNIVLPNIEQIHLYEINQLLKTDEFFDSLRTGYAEYDEWFAKSAKEGRQTWISWTKEKKVGALCIFKDAVDDIRTTDNKFISGPALKLCTFKVAPPVLGRKVGELFLKAAFKYAHEKGQNHIFLTMKDNHEQLAQLCKDFGFYELGKDDYGDSVYVKSHPTLPPPGESDALSYHIKFSPNAMASTSVQKYLVPIQPPFHDILFPEASDQQLTLRLDVDLKNPVNALKLAYICHAPVKTMSPGDILLFYRSGDLREVTTIGIVESAEHLLDFDTIINRVFKRTVYSIKELEDISKRDSLVILFRLAFHLPKNIPQKQLEEQGIIGPYQTIRKVHNDKFIALIQKAGIENRFAFN